MKSLRLVRTATPQERAEVMALLSWQPGENLLYRPAPVSPQSLFELERVRQVNLEYLSKMPNFLADEIVRRYHRDGAGKAWRLDATIEDEITIQDDRLTRRNFRRNGKPWNTQSHNSPSDFGLRLKSVFDQHCPTTIEFAGREEADGKPILVYLFRSPPDGCFGGIGHNGKAYKPAVTGRILADAATGNVIRCEWEGSGFPENFGVDRYMQTESWNYATIGGSSYLVQASHDFVLRRSDDSTERVRTE